MVTAPLVRRAWLRAGVLLLVSPTGAAAQTPAGDTPGYLTPPPAIVAIVDAPPTPTAIVGPTRDVVALVARPSLPSLAWLARPMHRLAGLRIDSRNSGPWRAPTIASITVTPLADDPGASATAGPDAGAPGRVAPVRIEAPRGTTLGWPQFAPDGRHLSYAVLRDTGIELWVVDLATGQPRPLTSAALNAVWGNPCEWLADATGVICRFRMSARGAPPDAPRTPAAPTVQEAAGEPAPVRTYQDLLRDTHDDALFAYHFTSQIETVTLATGSRAAVGEPGLYARVSGAPDGRHLLVERIQRPFSRLVPASRFARTVEIWTLDGGHVTLATRPVAETVPIGGVPTGPRAHRWDPTATATVVWREALDDGDPDRRVPHRDRLLALDAPYDGAPRELARTEFRLATVAWTRDGTMLVGESDRPTRWRRTWLRYPGGGDLRPLFDLSAEDRYGDPGTPLRQPGGGVASATILQDGDAIYLAGAGASPDGDRPFVDRLDLTTLETERLFQTDDGAYETVVAVLDEVGRTLLTRREGPGTPPNYVVRNLAGGVTRVLTDFADPAPLLRQVERRLITYTREDGVALSAMLYLPPGYREGTRVPLLMWAYPREYTNAAVAGQVRGSPYRFTTLSGASHLLLLAAGYAVLDGPAMPIVGEGETANDTYVAQLVSSARAAIDAVVELGVAERDRVAIGGHSYGAFMTANLLAHSDLFRAGIARSGAYNRSLTPFGFQNERRTFWEATEVYAAMSPFFHADRVNEPILLVHGEADDNAGTFPLQSERFYHALRGHGATVRYVTLPHESHGYAARESVLHVVAEMLAWCETYLGTPASQ